VIHYDTTSHPQEQIVSQADKPSLSYRDAGVDIEAGDALVDAIKPIAVRTRRSGCLDSLGGFGALFEVPPGRYRQPVLVSGTDGVGTKLKLALALDKHDTIGIDLVAMCVNDVLVQGAEPLFFLDYFATGHLEIETATAVISGIGRGCELAGAALIGGETAEMPGMYADGEYDLAGFCVGVVEKSRIIDGSGIGEGDVLIGLASSGAHSNGYSLIRKIIEVSEADLAAPFGDTTLGAALLAPTRIYVKPVLGLLEEVDVRGVAHITGGGLPGNLPRVIPEGLAAHIDSASWDRPAVFDWLQEHGGVSDEEMYRTFNCGIGMVIIVAPQDADRAREILTNAGEQTMAIGRIVSKTGDERVRID
jgi:phosphoribosylformylglycinamidine cyclo-ligase